MDRPSGSDVTSDPRVVAGRYALLSPLGSGGMGTVWRAEDQVLGREVAVKELVFPHGLSDEDREVLRERTRREARAAARLDHPSAVTVYDVVEQDGHPFLVMELVEARTLAETVRSDGPLPPAQVAEVGLAVLGALDAAHAQGIVHRDVKPGNVLLRTGGTGLSRVVLTDFGIATSAGDSSITSTGMLLGSPSYIAPERARGHRPGPPSDLWALGATLFTAVEGRPPYDAGDPLATVTAVVTGEHAPFVAAGPLEPVIRGLLEKDPEQRLDAATARGMLADVARGGAVAAAPPRPAPATRAREADRTSALPVGPVLDRRPAPAVPGPATAVPRPPRPSRHRRSAAVPLLLALVVFSAAILGAVVLLSDIGGSVLDRDADPRVSEAAPTEDAGGEGPDPGQREGSPDGPTAEQRPAGVPANWEVYVDDAEGWALWHPPSYQQSTRRDLVQFRDDDTRYTLRVDYTDDPRPSALQAWQEASPAFARSLGDYEQLRLEQVEYRGYDAADLEFTYSDSGADLRVLDRTFVVDDEAFALYWQVPADRFEESLPLFEQMAAAFVPNA